MFHIKICGVRQPHDVKAVVNCGGDAIGLNFFPRSVRSLDPTSPQTKVVSRLAEEAGLVRVGIFVNSPPETIAGIAKARHDVGLIIESGINGRCVERFFTGKPGVIVDKLGQTNCGRDLPWDHCAFDHAFRRWHGMSPSQWRGLQTASETSK